MFGGRIWFQIFAVRKVSKFLSDISMISCEERDFGKTVEGFLYKETNVTDNGRYGWESGLEILIIYQ